MLKDRSVGTLKFPFSIEDLCGTYLTAEYLVLVEPRLCKKDYELLAEPINFTGAENVRTVYVYIYQRCISGAGFR